MPRTRSGNTGHRQCKDEATGMSETIRPGKSNHGQSSTTDEATRKMLRPSKPYLDQCKDEATAIRESIRLLREIEVRSRRAAILCYKTSSANECLYILFAVIKVMVVAVVGIMTHKYLSKIVEENLPEIVSSIKQAPIVAQVIAGILASCIVFLVASEVLKSYYEDRSTRYNVAAAGWQALELKIRAFLATAIEGKVSSAEYKIFINECIEKREEICIKARPDEKIYKEYEKVMTIYDRDENVNDIHVIRINKCLY
ncbi:uncharacterized protein LOC124124429 [Haliotis rufescens]|uniref:uncharacterized protein LOC124124429 n=1 Tax=Haliotis rufescens TaxID=6454 RepID=UPI00201E8D0F|nr:uncharacterized protein LOC124124429 [Haliotis rufescens]XP_048241345.1 uncharacterized protein LOC124124429 [Haliotis rufescens]XP_048241346.1 uncharacterized protein LOC124124429 [Haliotis rufescens]